MSIAERTATGQETGTGTAEMGAASSAASSATIEFMNPRERIRGLERQSKLLAPGSSLYEWVTAAHATLLAAGAYIDVRPPHIEVRSSHERDDVAALTARAQVLQGRTVPLSVARVHKALVLPTPAVPGYGATHVTIAYFPAGLTHEDATAYARVLHPRTM